MESDKAASSNTPVIKSSTDLPVLKNAGSKLVTAVKDASLCTYDLGSKAVTTVKDASLCTYDLGSKAVTTVKDASLCTYDLGSKAVTTVKDKGPDSVKNALCGTLSLGSKAVAVVKENVPQMLKSYTPGPERIQQISPYVNHPATREFMRCFIPGVSPYISLAGAVMKGRSTGVQAGYDDKESENERLKAENERLKAEHERLKKTGIPFSTTQTRRSKL